MWSSSILPWLTDERPSTSFVRVSELALPERHCYEYYEVDQRQ